MAENRRLKYIGVKDLGVLAKDDFCSRCFWFERHFGPFPAPFPGIFNVIDKAAKDIVYHAITKEKKLPEWLKLEDVIGLAALEEMGAVEKHQNRKYLVAYHKKSGWILRGTPDRVFKLKNNTLHVIDFKTARFTEKQDSFFQLYEVQLNCYAILATKIPVSKLSLVYCEPEFDPAKTENFALTFNPKIINIDLNPKKIFGLLNKAREIVELKEPPPPKENCQGTCFYIEKVKFFKA